jgi:hypothetical protein
MNLIIECIVLKIRTFSRVKTQDHWLGNDNLSSFFLLGCVVFREPLFIFRVLSLVVVRVMLLQVFHRHNKVFDISFLAVCIPDIFRHVVGGEARCN